MCVCMQKSHPVQSIAGLATNFECQALSSFSALSQSQAFKLELSAVTKASITAMLSRSIAGARAELTIYWTALKLC